MVNELSVCIITCNDQPYILDCLSRLDGFSCDIIVVDIGSHDDTVDMARRQGANVFVVKWNGSFSEVRNFCMEQARGRWVLFLQANESVDLMQIDPLLKNPNAEGYLMTIDYNSEGYRVASPVQSLRLVRRHKENRFQYRSFEMIPDEILTGVVDAHTQIRQQDDAMLSWQLTRRLSVLKDEIAQHPDDNYLQYMQGLILVNQNMLEESAACFKAVKKNMNIGYLYAPHLYKCLSYVYLCLERYNDALRTLDEGIAYLSFYSDLLILRSEIYQQRGQKDNAIRDLMCCLKIRERPTLTVPPAEISSAYIYESLGDIYTEEHDYEQALQNYLQAYARDNSDCDLLNKTCRMIELTGSAEVIREAIEQDGQLKAVLEWIDKQHE